MLGIDNLVNVTAATTTTTILSLFFFKVCLYGRVSRWKFKENRNMCSNNIVILRFYTIVIIHDVNYYVILIKLKIAAFFVCL